MEINTEKTNFQNIFLFALFALLLVAVISILKPFFSVILWSALLYILISPLHRKIYNKMNPESKGFKVKRVLLSGSFAVGIVHNNNCTVFTFATIDNIVVDGIG